MHGKRRRKYIERKIRTYVGARQISRNIMIVINLYNHDCNHLENILTSSKRSIFRFLKTKVWISQHIILWKKYTWQSTVFLYILSAYKVEIEHIYSVIFYYRIERMLKYKGIFFRMEENLGENWNL